MPKNVYRTREGKKTRAKAGGQKNRDERGGIGLRAMQKGSGRGGPRRKRKRASKTMERQVSSGELSHNMLKGKTVDGRVSRG